MYKFDYLKALYRRNNFGQPCVWYAEPYGKDTIHVWHGIIGKEIINNVIYTNRKPADECRSRINAKRKTGYKYLSEIVDNVQFPVERELHTYLAAYLPFERTTSDGTLLPMLAKAYDNTNNKIYKKVTQWLGQTKINGLRCFISAEPSKDLFREYHLKFQSREGTFWNSLSNLEDYLLDAIPMRLLHKMVEEHYILDGEIYLPGYSINEINHFVKDPTCPENKLLQYWCYDIAVEDMTQDERTDILERQLYNYRIDPANKYIHLNNKVRLVSLVTVPIPSDIDAVLRRDQFIENGYEGLIMRDPDAEYQFGKRNLSMIKYKRHTDGKFKIIDIYPEGVKRSEIPLFLCKNDINDETFECHLADTMEQQSYCLINKDKYIGKYMFVEYGERSGVKQCPFHIKNTRIIMS